MSQKKRDALVNSSEIFKDGNLTRELDAGKPVSKNVRQMLICFRLMDKKGITYAQKERF
jgi:hypothetical protein